MIDSLAAMQLHGQNGLGESLAVLAAFLLMHWVASR